MATAVPGKTAQQEAKNIIDASAKESVILRGIVLVLLDAINADRERHGLGPYTMNQMKNAIKAKIDAGDAD